jgi:hypothetical protein
VLENAFVGEKGELFTKSIVCPNRELKVKCRESEKWTDKVKAGVGEWDSVGDGDFVTTGVSVFVGE